MITVLNLILLCMALLGMTLFGCSILWGIFAVLVGAALLVFRLIFHKRLAKPLRYAAQAAGTALCFVFLFQMGMRRPEASLNDYRDDVAKTARLIEQEKLDKAREQLAAMEEAWGMDDEIRGLYAMECIVRGDGEEALEYMEHYEDKTSPSYYMNMEAIYSKEGGEEAALRLYDLYAEAAYAYPMWTYMQKMAGIAAFEQDNPVSAQYYLLRAYKQAPEDAKVLYYLGAVSFRQGYYDDCLAYFDEALTCGADEELQSNMLWYMEQIPGIGGEEA